jgi:hypothetical protein
VMLYYKKIKQAGAILAQFGLPDKKGLQFDIFITRGLHLK